MRLVPLALLLAACSASAEPLVCHPEDRPATVYFSKFELKSGDCGTNPDPFNRDVLSRCERTAAIWTDNSCTLEEHYRCDLPAGSVLSLLITTTQRDASGSLLEGTEYVSRTGPNACAGTYEIAYVRK